VIGVDVAGNKYLLDGARHPMKLSERDDLLKRFYRTWSTEPGVQSCLVGTRMREGGCGNGAGRVGVNALLA
jgi:hypothetical protein